MRHNNILPRSSDHLNLIRGLAAVAVLLYHVRYRFFFDYSDLVSPSLAEKLLYSATAFGHDAVIIFFVLSGYFVSLSVTSAVHEGRWSWRSYFLNRFTRLYLVLLPGLALTFLWDQIGLTWFGNHPIYTGEARAWKHDFFSVTERLGVGDLLGNVLFLQTIYCPPYGSNEPLWSLAFEFWYYVAFPAGHLLVAARRIGWTQRLIAAALLAAAVMTMSRTMLIYLPIWLGGAVIAHLPKIQWITRCWTSWIVLAACAFLVVLIGGHLGSVRQLLMNSTVRMDYVTGCAFMGLLWIVSHDSVASSKSTYAGLSGALSDMSYTLYVVHMPLLVFLRAAILPNEPWTLGAVSLTEGVLLSLLSFAYAWVIAQLTEKHTARVRALIGGLWQRSGAAYPKSLTARRAAVIAPAIPVANE